MQSAAVSDHDSTSPEVPRRSQGLQQHLAAPNWETILRDAWGAGGKAVAAVREHGLYPATPVSAVQSDVADAGNLVLQLKLDPEQGRLMLLEH